MHYTNNDINSSNFCCINRLNAISMQRDVRLYWLSGANANANMILMDVGDYNQEKLSYLQHMKAS